MPYFVHIYSLAVALHKINLLKKSFNGHHNIEEIKVTVFRIRDQVGKSNLFQRDPHMSFFPLLVIARVLKLQILTHTMPSQIIGVKILLRLCSKQ